MGVVLEFDVPATVTDRWPIHLAGGKEHQELWVPADELEDFNKAIVGTIRKVGVFEKGLTVSVRDEDI